MNHLSDTRGKPQDEEDDDQQQAADEVMVLVDIGPSIDHDMAWNSKCKVVMNIYLLYINLLIPLLHQSSAR